ncbi:thioesterase II family protein [Cellvibrio japonicus]|uniref:Microcystin synthetase associated thioesterase n=1 Tax=Cellvibrio japonicus (strain Ueda107) TaxID=498211 RepID=B3PDZ3_CELJU|nr:alpha/beta fold hydrolase [Cellvibrio japonicus]ACE84610.1 microcystin synthetase associated thioesterase [Cellvibrio japonicus Ueda107]QEI13478.1 thioesterase [Cellvibrio japonicus]QEI17052.1 thioesterase [Cellvibrio japonicus]QEI20630.1 thioesterase [Cellvibrio japonicus]
MDGLLAVVKKNPNATIKLFCFPYAGGSAAIFQQWSRYITANVEVICLQLPGRGDRLDDDLYREMEPLLDDLLQEMMPCIDRPYVFLGYSLGAKTAYELARRLQALEFPVPGLFFSIASPAPHIPRASAPIHLLPDDQFIHRLREYQGASDDVLDDPDVMQLLLPGLRADFSILENYRYTDATKLKTKACLFGGADDMAVPYGHLHAWAEHFTGSVESRVYPGGHFFFDTSLQPFLQDINVLLNTEIALYRA